MLLVVNCRSLSGSKQFGDMFSRLITEHDCDRLTDGRTDTRTADDRMTTLCVYVCMYIVQRLNFIDTPCR